MNEMNKAWDQFLKEHQNVKMESTEALHAFTKAWEIQEKKLSKALSVIRFYAGDVKKGNIVPPEWDNGKRARDFLNNE